MIGTENTAGGASDMIGTENRYAFLRSTPAYIFDIPALHRRIAALRAAFGEIGICYAVKANPFLVPDLAAHADAFEVCSPGEYRICRRAGIRGGQMVYSGVCKAEADVRRALEECGDAPVYTVESPAQYELFARLAAEYGLRLRLCLRLSSGNQFGMDEQTLGALAARKNARLHAEGVQYYAGTQKGAAAVTADLDRLSGALARLRREAGFDPVRVEYGPGLSVAYFAEGAAPASMAPADLAQELRRRFPSRAAVAELGRYIAAPCGEYVTRVVDCKRTEGVSYCLVDGGINHLNYYGQTMAMKRPYLRCIPAREGEECHTVCGSLCTAADVLVRNCPLGGVRTGDLLVFANAGAYSVTEGIYLFLSRDLPAVYKRTADGETEVRPAAPTYPINSVQK